MVSLTQIDSQNDRHVLLKNLNHQMAELVVHSDVCNIVCNHRVYRYTIWAHSIQDLNLFCFSIRSIVLVYVVLISIFIRLRILF